MFTTHNALRIFFLSRQDKQNVDWKYLLSYSSRSQILIFFIIQIHIELRKCWQNPPNKSYYKKKWMNEIRIDDNFTGEKKRNF